MTWLHVYELIRAQLRFFPIGDIRPFAPLPKEWEDIEAMFRQHEEKSRPIVESAIDQFVRLGSWPPDMDDRERVWISGRIRFAKELLLRLSVPLSDGMDLLPVPHSISDEQLLIWLLVLQWDGLGFSEWLLDLEFLYQDRRQDQKEPFDSSRLPFFGGRDIPPPWSPN